MASAKIFKATAMAVIQVSMGFLKQGVSGLISGQIISQTIANFRLVKNLFEDKRNTISHYKRKDVGAGQETQKTSLSFLCGLHSSTVSRYIYQTF